MKQSILLRDEYNYEYEIDTNQIIGKGAINKVFNCYKKVGNQSFECCAKIINITPSNKEMVIQEYEIYKTIKNLQNPNIVTIHHLEIIEERSYFAIIMEKCISTLEQEQREKQKYEEEEILDFLRQFINGYKVLYDLKIIHRDIKPANILIQQYGNKKLYKLADFGIAQFCEQNNLWLTKLGTPMFASPELNVLNKDNNLRQNLAEMNKQHQRSVVDMYSVLISLNKAWYCFNQKKKELFAI